MICSYGTPFLSLASLENTATTKTIDRSLGLKIMLSLSSFIYCSSYVAQINFGIHCKKCSYILYYCFLYPSNMIWTNRYEWVRCNFINWFQHFIVFSLEFFCRCWEKPNRNYKDMLCFTFRFDNVHINYRLCKFLRWNNIGLNVCICIMTYYRLKK